MRLGEQFKIKMYFEDGKKIYLNELGLHKTKDYIVDFEKIETAYYGTCYKIIPSINRTIANGENTRFALKFPKKFIKYEDIPPLKIFFTSEKNSLGIIRNAWKDGEIFDVTVEKNTKTELSLKPTKYVLLDAKSKCRKKSFYECFESEFFYADFSECPKKCTIGKK